MKTDNELYEEKDMIDTFMGRNHLRPASGHKFIGYHNSWDMLMPVVEKIEEMGFKITFDNTECTITNDDSYIRTQWGKDANTKIIFVYKAVVEFIKWFNQQSNG